LRKFNSFFAAFLWGFFLSTPALFFSTARNLYAAFENEEDDGDEGEEADDGENVERTGVPIGEGSEVSLYWAVGALVTASGQYLYTEPCAWPSMPVRVHMFVHLVSPSCARMAKV
jgi:hypothetical protein